MTTIKISFNDDMRRFTLSGEEARGMATYSNFVQTVQGLFPSLAGREFSLHWYDDDGDKITVSSELEFQEALRFMREQSRTTGKNIVRFEVVAQDGSTPAADSASTAGASVSEAVHVGVTCDECGMSPIRGLRFKCTVREDYDLCAACEARREQPYPMVKLAQPGAALFYAFREDGPRHGGPPPCGGRGGGRRGPWRAARGRCPWGAQLADVLGVPTGKEHEERAKRCRERWQRKAEHVGRHVEETVRPFVEAMDRIFGEDNKTNPAASDATATPSAQTEEAHTTLEEQLMQEAIQESLLLNEVAQAFSAAEISPVESQSTATAAAVPPPPPPLTTSSAPIMTKPALRFVKDVTFPDGAAVQPGAVLRKVWKVRNDGAGTWPEGCVLTTAGGDLLCAEDLTVPLPSVVSGAESEIGVELRAPELPGMYTAYFRAQTREGQSFGHRLWATLQVQEIEEAWTAVTKPDAELGVNSQATSPAISPAASTVTPVAPAALPPVASAVSAVPAAPAVSTPVASTPSVASTASTPAPVQPLQLLWRRELSMLADMGFVDAEAALPLLQRHLVTPVSLSGDRGAPPSVEGMQRVVAALLGM